MQNKQKSTSKKGIALLSWCTSIAMILTLTGTASAQQSAEKSKLKPDQIQLIDRQLIDSLYTRALEDSLIVFEKLKPAYKFLQISYNFKNAETESLRSENRILREMQVMQKDEFDRSLAGEKQKGKKSFWRGTAIGVALSILLKAL